MINEFTFECRINNKGEIIMLDKEAFKKMGKDNKNTILLLKSTIIKKNNEQGLIGYYWKKIVKDFQLGFISLGEVMSINRTEQKLRELSQICEDENGEIREFKELSFDEKRFHIEQLKIIGATDFSIVILDNFE